MQKRPRTPSTSKKPQKKQRTSLLYQQPAMRTVEKKDHAISLQLNTAIADTWGTSPGWAFLNGIAVGSQPNERIGRKIKMVSLSLHWNAFVAPTSTQGGQVRIKAIYDRAPNGFTPSTTAILDADSFLAHNALANSERFVTLLDFVTPPISVNEDFSVSGKEYVKMALDSQYGGSGFTVGSINTGAIFINAVQTGTILTASPSVKIRSRIRYLDS